MEVLTLLLFVGAIFVLAGVGFFAWSVATAHHQHTDRLAVLPLEDNWRDPKNAAAESES